MAAVTLAECAQALAAARRLLVTSHLAPDGDATGSMCALGLLAQAAGQKVTVYNPDPVPRPLRGIPGADRIAHRLEPSHRFDLTVVVDCGDVKLLGERFPAPEQTGPLLVIDHHGAGRPFGDLYWCDPAAPSVGVMIARLARELGWPLSADAAVGIYTSLAADTGWFRYANTTAEAFRLAAELVELHGVDPWQVAERVGEDVPIQRYRLLAQALGTIELEHGGRVALIVISDEMVRAAGASYRDSEGLVNYARAIAGVECGVLLSPLGDGQVRVSLRSRGRLDAGAVALALGGGGHRGAAGCRLGGSLAEVRAVIVAALGAALGQAPGPGDPS